MSRLAKDLPDMEMKINVFDYPCTMSRDKKKAPVLSFSKVNEYTVCHNVAFFLRSKRTLGTQLAVYCSL